jgi:homoserine O-acetyltransferase/O-succinyltransferase
MRARAWLIATILMAAFTHHAEAHGPNDPPHQSYAMGDFKLESGEVIRDFQMTYVTHGTLNAKKSNAILMTASIGGNHHRIDYLIGPGRALDPSKYFIICTDAIGNGLTTSPSNSKTQPGMSFPKFNMRDMVNSSARLAKEKFGIDKLVAAIGASMGGMQTLQFGVSYPDGAQSLIAIIPLGKTTPWTTNALELTRQAIMSDPAWDNGNYPASAPPEKGMRMWARILFSEITRTPQSLQADLPSSMDAIAWQANIAETSWKRMDARDWVYQTWAYDQHNVGTTPGFNGDYFKALKSIKAKTLVLAGEGDLLNPEANAFEAAQIIPDARYVKIFTRTPLGHTSGAGATAPENELQNREISAFLDVVTDHGAKLK